MELPKL